MADDNPEAKSEEPTDAVHAGEGSAVEESATEESAARPDAEVPGEASVSAEADEPSATDKASADGLPELTLGEGAPADTEAAAPSVHRSIRGKVDKFGAAIGTGRRKTSVARVRIRPGTGALTINGRDLTDYCRIERDRLDIEAPLHAAQMQGKVDVWIRVNGGGTTGQSGAIVLGIARALQALDPALHGKLAEGGYLTRDGRMVERKKYGYKKARKSFQFSKR